MNYYERYVGDIQRDTGHLSCAAMGVYDRLLDHYYATERALPADIDALCRIARAMDATERKAVEDVVREFFQLEGDSLYHQHRTDAEITKAQSRIEAAQENGKQGGKATAKKHQSVASPGSLYAIRLSHATVKVGVSTNFRSRLHQHRKKIGHHVTMVHVVAVDNMGEAFAGLKKSLGIQDDADTFALEVAHESTLKSFMDLYLSHTQSYATGNASRIASRTAHHTPYTITTSREDSGDMEGSSKSDATCDFTSHLLNATTGEANPRDVQLAILLRKGYGMDASSGSVEVIEMVQLAVSDREILDAVANFRIKKPGDTPNASYILKMIKSVREKAAKAAAAANGTASSGGAPAPASTDWWHLEEGVRTKAVEFNVVQRVDKNEHYRSFRIRVFKAAGEGPWREAALSEAARDNPEEHARVLGYFYDQPPAQIGQLAQRAQEAA